MFLPNRLYVSHLLGTTKNAVVDYFTRDVVLCLLSNLLRRNTFGALLRFSGL